MPSSAEVASTEERSVEIEKDPTSSEVSSSDHGIKNTQDFTTTAKEKEINGIPTEGITPQWISGLKLWTVMFSISIASFLMLLDTAIIITVRPSRLIVNRAIL